MIKITNHARIRARDRANIHTEDELLSICEKVIKEGIKKENTRTKLRNYVKNRVASAIDSGTQNPYIRIYKKKIYIFSHESKVQYTLITIIDIPMCDGEYLSMIK